MDIGARGSGDYDRRFMRQPLASHDPRAIWSIALPAMATNVATALLGIADIWIIGQLGDASAQGAVELGARLLMGLLVVFNFLKTATTGLTAQAAGQHNEAEKMAALLRASVIALAIGLVLLATKPLTVPLGLDLLAARDDVRADAALYIDIRFWAAPAWLLNAALVGWLIGLRRVRTVLVVEVAVNVTNIGLGILFVLIWDMGVAGLAYATLISEMGKFVLLVFAIFPSAKFSALAAAAKGPDLWNTGRMGALFRVNRDLFLRTLLLTIAIMLVTRQGAIQGTDILAANAILFQMFMLTALLLDGFENAAQVLCGETIGAKDREGFDKTVQRILLRGIATALVLTAIFAIASGPIVASFSTDPAVVETVLRYDVWLLALPLAGVASFVMDGVFVGATWTRAMLGTMAAAFLAYGAMLWLTGPLGNHGLWLSFTVFLLIRAVGQFAMTPRLAARTFAPITAEK
ncbi:MAG: MATE family efflux transporter [Pseudomonadota bacterium]